MGLNESHFDYKVEDGWVGCGNFKMGLGNPVDGYEKTFVKIEDTWIYL
ncbi:hypothetical protein GH808_03000 [Acetobacterium fimetarium]|uniref:Uncharacterized protein n=2 Tax=Acetobacterium TaxID=33951 RepID=A0ABR6Z260_9FIRM|nr:MULTISPECIES: hypothetical protein [Acetobacterium]MBC3803404.1 hypothetical protein [Acetobacterium fimetarium]MBC3901489.1 hypothetical protein [Acetobacterium malicum]